MSQTPSHTATTDRPALLRRAWRARHRWSVLVVLAVLASTFLMPRSIPAGIHLLGVVAASTMALNAVGMVLVYRSNRIINFAQVAPGAAAALIFISLVRYRPFLHWADFMCEGRCIDNRALLQANYWVSLALALGLSVLFSWLIYAGVIRRFARAPRLILTVATVLVVPILVKLAHMAATGFLVDDGYKAGILPTPGQEAVRFPSDFSFQVRPSIFHASDVLTVEMAVLAIVGILLYLRFSATGTAIRASAEDPERAESLGIDVHTVTSRVWMLSGFLSGVAALLLATSFGGAVTTDVTVSMLVRTLTVAVLAGMTSIPMAAFAALGLGIFEQATVYSFDAATLFEMSLFLVVAAGLLAQVRRTSRAEQEQAGSWRAAKEVRPVPEELRGLAIVRRWRFMLGAGTAIVLLGLPWMLSPGDNTLASVFLVYLVIGFSVLVLTGWAGEISLGQLGLAAVGAWAAAASGLPFPFAILLGGLVGAVVALVVGLPALRLRGLHLAIMTLTFAVAANGLLLDDRYLGKHLPDGLDRPVLVGMDFDDERVFYYFALVFAVAVAMGVLGLRRSRTARALLAVRDNPQAAQAYGINLVRARLGAFVASGFIAALAGGVYAYHQKGVELSSFDPALGIDLFLVTVVGGLGSVAGPVLGILIYGFPVFFGLPEFIQLVVTGPGLLVLLLFLPNGVGQLAFDARDHFLRRVAARHRILVPSLVADRKREDLENERAPIVPKLRPGGAAAFVPTRYALASQWGIEGSGNDG